MKTRIYVGTYAKYNSGSIGGEWLDLSDYSDAEELYEVMHELHNDEEDPEFMIQDREGDLAEMIDECMTPNEFEKIYSFIDEIENSHLDLKAVVAYCNHTGCDLTDGLDKAEEAYQGEYESDEDFAEEFAEELGYLNKENSWPHTCIDWNWAARELMYDYFEEGGYYFRHI